MSGRITVPALIATLALSACGSDGPTPIDGDGIAADVALSVGAGELDAIGATVALTATVRDATGRVLPNAAVTWATSAAGIATVDGEGVVTAASNGAVRVTAMSGSASASVDLTVQQVPVGVSVELSEAAIFLPGPPVQATASVVDRLGAPVGGHSFQWSSSDPAIVTVDGSGLATGLRDGVASLTATADGLAITGSSEVSVVEDANQIVAFVGVRVLPMTEPGALDDQTVVTSDGVIVTIGARSVTPVPEGAFVVDAAGMTLMPGLADAHVHVFTGIDFIPYLANGVTTVINLGHAPFAPVFRWRDQIASGELLGPTVLATGITIDGAGPRQTAVIVTTPEEGRAIVQSQFAEGADYLKVYNDLTTPVFEAIADEAARLGIPMVGHGVRAPGLDGILAGGVAAIAHAEEIFYTHFSSVTDATLIPSAVQLLADANAWVMPNLSAFSAIAQQVGNTAQLQAWLAQPEAAYMSQFMRDQWPLIHNANYANQAAGSLNGVLSFLTTLTGAMYDGGVRFLLSTDSPVIPGLFAGYSIHDDLELMVAAGVPVYDALRAGTINAGQFVVETAPRSADGMPLFGGVHEGWKADLLLVEGDPVADLGVLRDPRGVMFGGRWMSRNRLKLALDDAFGG